MVDGAEKLQAGARPAPTRWHSSLPSMVRRQRNAKQGTLLSVGTKSDAAANQKPNFTGPTVEFRSPQRVALRLRTSSALPHPSQASPPFSKISTKGFLT